MKVKHIVLIMFAVIALVGLVLLVTYNPTDFWAFINDNVSINIDINPFTLSLSAGIVLNDNKNE